jgi:alanyl-tRNA synthetase
MLTQQLRRKFIDYFKSQNHTHVTSSAVIPHDDPTLLFTNAGMNQFKEVFLGASVRDYTRAVTCQKCIRAGGKHNDLENVGHTARHLTLFEMLGNFSFGDYFKEEAIRFAWHVSTVVFGFDPDRIWPTIYQDDEEAFQLWTNYVPASRITRFGKKDNFWAMGDTGPCGPCSELFYDRGPAYGNATSPANDTEGTRFLEFWNLVFMQYNCQPDGTLVPLPKPCVDTGAGLERIIALKMDVDSLFETDTLRSIIAQIEELSKISYDTADSERKPAFRVIADHLRSLSFAIADGAQPSNVERGYVLRKILRRAVRYGRMLGFDKPFLAQILPRLVATMGSDYPELVSAEKRIAEILTLEEESFLRTLQRGGNMLQQVVNQAHLHGNIISGDDAFKLKDTYGLPLEEIALIAKDNGLTIDEVRFEELSQEARERSKRQHKNVQHTSQVCNYAELSENYPKTRFTGYDTLSSDARILALWQDDQPVDTLEEGSTGSVLLDSTPFYATMGGQIGDKGVLLGNNSSFSVEECTAPQKGFTIHTGTMTQGMLSVGDTITATVETERRQAIAAHHTATHLLHWALQQVLGEHVRQAGSVVDAERLRFDFSHHKALTPEEIVKLEDAVNAQIRANTPVKWYEISYEEAQQQRDIKQFFGDKYDSTVRVVDIDFSKELCGGTHATHTGSLGYFAIAKEGSIAAGVRRIEAFVGLPAEALRRADAILIDQVADTLKTKPSLLLERVQKLQEEHKALTQEIKKLRQQQLMQQIENLIPKADKIGNITFLTAELNCDGEELRSCAEELMQRLSSAVVVLNNNTEGRCQVIVRVSDDLTAHINAGALAKLIATYLGGSGGGKPSQAQAGGKDSSQMPQALAAVKSQLTAVPV